jgi:dihydrolipoamide dehydrogenase
VAKQLNSGVGHLMKKNKVTVVMGEATLPAKGKVSVKTDKGTEELTAKNIILATGARARELPGLEADGKRVWTYKAALVPPHMPKKLLVIGSGAIGIEFASFYNTLGADTTVVEVMDRILPVEDEEIQLRQEELREAGDEDHGQGHGQEARPRRRQGHRPYRGGRQGRDAGVRHRHLRRGHRGQYRGARAGEAGREDRPLLVVTDEYCRTGVEGLLSSATHQRARGWRTRRRMRASWWPRLIAGKNKVHPVAPENIAGCTYCHPQVASVGLTEAKAKEKGYTVKVGRFPFIGNGKAIALGEPRA